MFCKYCGRDIPDTAACCPECGKRLKTEETQATGRGDMGAPFILLLVLLCWNTASVWAQMLLPGYGVGWYAVLSMLALIAGIAITVRGVTGGRIDPSVYRLSDAAVLACACIAVPMVTSAAGRSFLTQYWGQYGAAAVTCANAAEDAIRFMPLWMAAGIALLGTARTGRQTGKKRRVLLFAAPLLCVFVGISFARPIIHSMDAPMEVLAVAIQCAWTGSLFCWLWPLTVLRVLHALGEGRIGPVSAAAVFLGTAVGECFLLSVFIFLLDMGITGYTLAHGLAPLFSLLFLRIAVRRHKTKKK